MKKETLIERLTKVTEILQKQLPEDKDINIMPIVDIMPKHILITIITDGDNQWGAAINMNQLFGVKTEDTKDAENSNRNCC